MCFDCKLLQVGSKSITVMFYKFLDARKLCCNQPKIDTTGASLRVLHQKDANGKANSEDPDQTAPLVFTPIAKILFCSKFRIILRDLLC